MRRTCFGTLPSLLVLHLKRFDLDYNTFETVKLNNRCSFPMDLNMRKYTKEGIEADEAAAAAANPPPPPSSPSEGGADDLGEESSMTNADSMESSTGTNVESTGNLPLPPPLAPPSPLSSFMQTSLLSTDCPSNVASLSLSLPLALFSCRRAEADREPPPTRALRLLSCWRSSALRRRARRSLLFIHQRP